MMEDVTYKIDYFYRNKSDGRIYMKCKNTVKNELGKIVKEEDTSVLTSEYEIAKILKAGKMPKRLIATERDEEVEEQGTKYNVLTIGVKDPITNEVFEVEVDRVKVAVSSELVEGVIKSLQNGTKKVASSVKAGAQNAVDAIKTGATKTKNAVKESLTIGKETKRKVVAGALATTMLLAGTGCADERENVAPNIKISETSPVANYWGEDYLRTYIGSNGKEYLMIDSVAILNTLVYQDELGAYTNYSTKGGEYKFNPYIFADKTLMGIMFLECGAEVNDKTDEKYFGCYKIGKEALEEANKVYTAIHGKPIAGSLKELKNPEVGARASFAIMVANYTYLTDAVGEENVTLDMLLDSYLYGATGVLERLVECKGKYQSQSYSQEVKKLSNVFDDRLTEIRNDPNKAFNTGSKGVLLKLMEITEEYNGKRVSRAVVENQAE